MSEPIVEATLDNWEQLAREATERGRKATAGPWDAEASADVCAFDGEYVVRFSGGGASYELEESDATFIAHAREDVPMLSASVLALSAEVRSLRSRLDRVTHERECLGTAIADAALKAGIYSGVPVTGPELILLAQEMANVIVRAQVARDPRVAIGEMAVDSGEEET